ncbi:MAG: YraN family protein [Nitrospira sp.]|nr:YraN family protein [Nitrospira sp.]
MDMKKADTRAKGRHGEEMAAEYLVNQGYRVLEKNYRNHFGEIDIIAEESGTIVFIEVKLRNLNSYGSPEAAVDTWKQLRLSRTAAGYIAEKRVTERPCRFDVVSIYKGKVDLIRDAFELSELISW